MKFICFMKATEINVRLQLNYKNIGVFATMLRKYGVQFIYL